MAYDRQSECTYYGAAEAAKYGIKMNSKKKRKLNYFFLLQLIIMSVLIIFLSAIIAIYMHRKDQVEDTKRLMPILFFLWITVCTIVANLILYIKMHKVFCSVTSLSEAMDEVAKGNFDVQLKAEEHLHIAEIENMCASFNQMVQELGTIETLRNDFVANVSHEMKTPVAAIDGYAALLQDPNLTQEERDQHLESILYNCRRLTALTGNILMISRLDNGTMIPKKETFRLDEQIRRIVLSMEDAWTKKEMELDIEMDPVTYVGDEDLLYHIWTNLISNAIKFSKPGGLLQIRMEDNPSETGVVCVTVRDTGIGLTSDQMAHMYDKFYQGDKSHTREGNGLGLALVRQITELLGISISANSKKGQGTTFILELPIEESGQTS